MEKIKILCVKLHIKEKTTNYILELYKNIEARMRVRFKATTAVLAVCIYIGCKKLGNNCRSIQEIVRVSGITQNEFSKQLKWIKIHFSQQGTQKNNPDPKKKLIRVNKKTQTIPISTTSQKIMAIFENHYRDFSLPFSALKIICENQLPFLISKLEGKRPVTLAAVCLVRFHAIPVVKVSQVLRLTKATILKSVEIVNSSNTQ